MSARVWWRVDNGRRSVIRHAALLGLLVASLAAPALAVETIDEDLMYDIDDLHAALKQQLARQDAARTGAAATKLQALLAQVEAFYARDPATKDAVGFARKAQALSAQLGSSSAAGDWPAAATAYQALSASCKSCHSRYNP
ncbi:hypothetical protein [Pseudoxanthomonas sp.]|uniref:hypothetical protein n=1 Tax=Pseudoxanthomonas sp. TaxID=1871049 RepID=UPI002631B15E|nr:hypothetical protein [Pseudoxanthomonas sp.]WDS37001.1 MAG: hypothetical protein O8I58_03590 [Pseudoxanthomonas sp.]